MKRTDRVLEMPLSFGTLKIMETWIGRDLCLSVSGGRAHIGCTVLAVPRKSLRKDGAESCTSSVLNVTGHKDEEICRLLAERAAVKYRTVAVCTGGIHLDGITEAEIQEIQRAAENAEL